MSGLRPLGLGKPGPYESCATAPLFRRLLWFGYSCGMERRKRQRLAGFDYAQAGTYFITINTAGRACLFGEIALETMQLNALGDAVAGCWRDLPRAMPSVVLHEWILMPNHFHGLLTLEVSGMHALPDVVRTFKSMSTRIANQVRGTSGAALWHRSYYDHVVRNEVDLDRIREYIVGNPAKWDQDEHNPERWRA
jgi:REP element-mobilizing transposase RayT